jgi:hypothetical protein
MERAMNRLRDYLCFTVQFVGFGYAALWPVSTPAGGDLFGASLLCGGEGALEILCRMPHPLQLGIGLHAAGALCAIAATLHLCLRAMLRGRRRRDEAAVACAPIAPGVAAAARMKPRAPRRPMPPPRAAVPARSHFGLRGVPR